MFILESLQTWFLDHPFFGTLLFLMVVDIVLGLLRSFREKRLSSDVSGRGMTKKVVMLILVLVCEVLSRTTQIPGPPEVSSIFFVIYETISVIENAALLGAPIPPPLAAILIQLRTMTGGDQQFRLGDSPQEHARIIEERAGIKSIPSAPDLIDEALNALEKSELP